MAKYPEGVECRGNSIRITFQYKGRRCRETLTGWPKTPSNIKKAGRLRAAIMSDIADGTFDYLNRFPNSKTAIKLGSISTLKKITTLSQLIELWLKIKEPDLTPITMRKVKSVCKVCINIMGADRTLNMITHEDILKLRAELLSGETHYTNRGNKKGRKAKTVNNYLVILGEIFKFATRSNYFTVNPFDGVKGLKATRQAPDPLEKDEFTRLITHPRTREYEKNLWTIAIHTGLRHGELCGLAWEDIDLERGTLHVRRSLTAKGDFKLPKTESSERTIHLLQPAIDALRSQQAISFMRPVQEVLVHLRERAQTRTDLCRWVFVTGLGETSNNKEAGSYYSTVTLRNCWDSCMKRTGIRRRPPYHTRHTYACWLLTSGANPNFIANQMGHKSTMMVLTVYGDWMPSESENQIEMLNEKFRNAPYVPHPNTKSNN